MHIEGNTFIVTGAASGLGEHVARSIVDQGGHVVIMDINCTRAKQLVQSLGSDKAYFDEPIDVTEEEKVQKAIETGVSHFRRPLAGVVVCSGIVWPPQSIVGYGPNQQLTSYAQFKHVININLLGAYNVAQKAAEHMIHNTPFNEDGERGVIITTSSMLGLDGTLVGYGTSKAGVAGLTLPLAKELSEFGIRVMSIAPGPFETPLVQAAPVKAPVSLFPKRHGQPSEFSDLVLHIITHPMLNGSVIRLDGGLRG
ncbi:short-chain dehydrogenase [Fennellomyces sp. T-0311]|nr:short-chain dehydrogenase [Fennellomyces sp. T-0311]